ncbi:immunoglobulin domain-containing protein [Ditylenchus destructor]|nr:immunoglobulin domain-containing protein [Ditylenchus destructor]
MKLSNNIIANFHLFTCKNVCSLIFLLILAVDILFQVVVSVSFRDKSESRKHSAGPRHRMRKETDLIQSVVEDIPSSYYSLGWAKWSEWSSCSKSCGDDGIQFQLRRCLDMYCSGPPSRHRVCPEKPCPNDQAHQNDAQIECALRNRPPFGFLPDKWTPVTAINNCSLSCRSEQTGKIKHFGISLKDGAKCKRSDTRHSACQAGKCQPVGCDRIIGSAARIDECGRCGGDGSSCAKKIFRWKDTLQFTPCDKTCGPNSVRVSVSVCVNTATDRVVPERLCADQERPRPQVKRCPYVVCPAKWLTGSWTDCSATCGSGQQYRQVFCLADAVENRKVADQYCWQQQKPITERECGAPCPVWEIGDWGECSETCGKGLRKRNVECRQGNERTEDIMCSDQKRPVQTQPCYTSLKCPASKGSNSAVSNASPPHYRFGWQSSDNQLDPVSGPLQYTNENIQSSGIVSLNDNEVGTMPNIAPNNENGDDFDKSRPRFHTGVWGDCSASCGPGVRSRSVECVAFQGLTADMIKLPDYECDGQTKPTLFQPCQLAPCRLPQQGPSFSPQGSAYITVPEEASYDRRRNANSLAEFSSPVTTHDRKESLYRWEYGEWGPCSASCLAGKQKSTLKCVDLNRKQSVSWSNCDSAKRPIDLTRSCNKQACPPEWEVTEFSQCSHSCNGGIRTRRVRCIRKVSRIAGAESTLILPDEQCPLPKPNDQTGAWSLCSASCGDGEQRRSVQCEQRDPFGNTKVFNSAEPCAGSERPPTVQLCNLGHCEETPAAHYRAPSPLALVQNRPSEDDYDSGSDEAMKQTDDSAKGEYYDQSHPNHRKLTLNVGGYANLYEGTSIKVKCPVRNFNRQRIYWTKDGNKIVNNAHTKVSSNGALRIFHARMEDAGLYACFANGVQGNVTLRFKHRESSQKASIVSNETKPKVRQQDADVSQNRSQSKVKVEKEILQKIRNSLYRLGEYRVYEKLGSVTDPTQIKVDYVSGEWSQCSQIDCGRPDGAQVRMLKCQIHVESVSAYVDDDICEGFGVSRPPSTRPCHDPRCPSWEASEWSSCSESRCVRHTTALQRRQAKCLYTNGTEADFSLCDRKNRPKIKKECTNSNCTAEWRPSAWGACSKTCGDGGVQMRLLRCVWHGTKKAAGRNCDRLPTHRPAAIRACEHAAKLPPCGVGEDMDQSQTQITSANRNSTYAECEDKSRFCDILKLFHSCDQERIRSKCCYSCYVLDSKRTRNKL